MALRASARPPNCAKTTEVSTKLLWPPLACAPLLLVQPFPVCQLRLKQTDSPVLPRQNASRGWCSDSLSQQQQSRGNSQVPKQHVVSVDAHSCPCAEAIHVERRYAELLKEIRMGHVRKVMYFDNDESAVSVEDYQEVEGPCLVVFNDNRVAHSYVPRFDYRIP